MMLSSYSNNINISGNRQEQVIATSDKRFKAIQEVLDIIRIKALNMPTAYDVFKIKAFKNLRGEDSW